MKNIVTFIIALLLIAPAEICRAGDNAKPAAGPTTENALEAEQEIAQALLANDADAVKRLLDDDWAVISADGGLGDGIREGFCACDKVERLYTKDNGTGPFECQSATVRKYRSRNGEARYLGHVRG